MVLRSLLARLLNSQQLIESLSETRLMRRAAQLTVASITRAQDAIRDAVRAAALGGGQQQQQQQQEQQQQRPGKSPQGDEQNPRSGPQ
ncbi:unnamed protein product [Lampetra planeri]